VIHKISRKKKKVHKTNHQDTKTQRGILIFCSWRLCALVVNEKVILQTLLDSNFRWNDEQRKLHWIPTFVGMMSSGNSTGFQLSLE